TDSDNIERWTLLVTDKERNNIRRLMGTGAPAAMVEWDRKDENGHFVESGKNYYYQFILEYEDGTYVISAYRAFGISGTSRIDVRLTGASFELGEFGVNEAAREKLSVIAKELGAHPDRKIIIEGYTDSIGIEKNNLSLSLKRAQAIESQLISLGIAPSRIILKALGESNPIASNSTEEGREKNRRVEIKSDLLEVIATHLREQYRTSPKVFINQEEIALDEYGRFQDKLALGENTEEGQSATITMNDARGRFLEKTLDIPLLDVLTVSGELTNNDQIKSNLRFVGERTKLRNGVVEVEYALRGSTDPENTLLVDGELTPVSESGRFDVPIRVSPGENVFSLETRNAQGFTRLVDVYVSVSDKDENNDPVVVTTPVPYLSVKLPLENETWKSARLPVSGKTEVSNTITINDHKIKIDDNGYFSTLLPVQPGLNTVLIEVEDSQGHIGKIEREIKVADNQMFFLAFADGEFGLLNGGGFLPGAGMEKSQQEYIEGRLAYYFKGTIKGKYLITSAFDTGRQNYRSLFKDLDTSETDRLLTNIDPEKAYSVYGDDSILVDEMKGQGKFYLSIESDELKLLVGNYLVQMNENSLANVRRNYFGAQLQYQTKDRTRYQKPKTKAEVFIAENRRAHTQNEIQATGGSLYYLSQRGVIEDSEQVVLEIRDKLSGNLLQQLPQQRGRDYQISYDRGRLIFMKPVKALSRSSRLIDLGGGEGNPVSIMVDYDYASDNPAQLAGGGMVRQQLGDHVAIGATGIQESRADGEFRLEGINTEIRMTDYTRLRVEIARSSGVQLKQHSDDGGFTFTETPFGATQGTAWKVNQEADLGEWVGFPGRVFADAFVTHVGEGFSSSSEGSADHQRDDIGAGLRYKITADDIMQVRHERLNRRGQDALHTTSLLWQHEKESWTLSSELQNRDVLGVTPTSQLLSAIRLDNRFSDKLSTEAALQYGLIGETQKEVHLGVTYQAFKQLAVNGVGSWGNDHRSAEAGISYRIGDSRLYLSERLSEQAGTEQQSTVVGEETALGRHGRFYSEYQRQRGASGSERDVSLVGAERTWKEKEGWSFTLSGDYSSAVGSNTRLNGATLGGTIKYKQGRRWKLFSRNEAHRQWGDSQILQLMTNNDVTYKLTPSYSLLAKQHYSQSKNLSTQALTAYYDERSIGIALRPINNDRFNALGRYTWLSDLSPQSAQASRKEVASLDWSFDITQKLEWTDKLAARRSRFNEADSLRKLITTHTLLSIHRLNYNIWKAIEVGGVYRI
ncbi:MAG: OmpA family protein, partial [Gammaproteobacteria bacterium]|nr:OmpA family protein [Gammaproteobacteria bacterium]